MYIRLLAALLFSVVLLPIGSASNTPSSSMILEEVIITAIPLRQRISETTQPVRVISAEELLRLRAPSLGQTLNELPGISASYFGPIASRPIIRGQGGLRVQIYQDGSDSLDASSLSDDHAVTVDPLISNSIEVIRGPAALLFGSSAAAGAINIITQRIPSMKLTKNQSSAIEVRSDTALSERAVTASGELAITEQWQAHADVQSRRTGDVRIPGIAWSKVLRKELALLGESTDETSGRLLNSASDTQGGSLGVARISQNGWFGLSASRFAINYGLPGPSEEPGEPPSVSLDMQQNRYDMAGEWRPEQGAVNNFRLHLAHNDYEHSEFEGDGGIGTRYAQIGREVRLSAEHKELNGWCGTFGLQSRTIEFDATGAEAFLPKSSTRNLGLFIFEERSLGAVILESGARYEYQNIKALIAEDYKQNNESTLNISLGTIWQLTPNSKITIQLNKAERHPTATELYAHGAHLAVHRFEIGDATLGIERSKTADLGLIISGKNYAWRGSISAFISDYSNYISAQPLFGIEDNLPIVAYQTNEARFIGTEFELDNINVFNSKLGAVDLRFFGDFVRANDTTGTPLPQIPPLRLGSEISLNGSRLRIAINALWHDRQTRVAENERVTSSYTLLSVDLNYLYPLGRQNLILFARASNLGNIEARSHTSPIKDYAPLAGRSLNAGFRVEF